METVDRLFATQRHLRQQGGEPDRRTKLLRHQKAVSPIHPNSARVAMPKWQCHFGNGFMGQRRDPIRIGMNPVGGLRPCFLLFFPRGRLPPPTRSHFAFGSAHDTSGNTFRRSRLKISDQMFWNRHAVPPAAFVQFPEVADFHQSGAAFFQHPFQSSVRPIFLPSSIPEDPFGIAHPFPRGKIPAADPDIAVVNLDL